MNSHRPRVLFVDDEPNLLETAQDLLRREFEVITATSAAAALARLATEDIPIVVSDLRMPEMDGITFLGQVRQRAPETVRLLLTGHADLNAAVRAVNLGGIFRLLLKPCHPDDLKTALRDAVEQRRIVSADRELLAGRVEELSSRLVHAERLATLGTMAASVSHEMNNALGVLSVSVREIRQLLESGGAIDAELVELLETGEQRLRRHAAGVLGLAHKSQGRARIDIGQLIKDVAVMMRDLGIAKRVSVAVTVPEKPVWVVADRTELEQVLINLIKNAVEAIEDSGRRRGSVNVETRIENDQPMLIIKDDGTGIPEDRRAKIFEPFFTTKEPGRGTGLGLSVVKQIIDAYAATIDVESAPRVGTTFTVRFPAA